MDALETPDIRADGIDQDRATLSVVLEDCAGEPPGVGGQVGLLILKLLTVKESILERS